MKCRTCGKKEEEFESRVEFIKHCKLCKKGPGLIRPGNGTYIVVDEAEPVDTPDDAPDVAPDIACVDCDEVYDAEPVDTPELPISIPLSVCPPELAYLHENRQMFLRVAGRKMGDKFIIEELKVWR